MEDHRYWVGFNQVPGIGPKRMLALLDKFGDIKRAWEASPRELQEAGLDARSLENLVKVRRNTDLDQVMQRLSRLGATVLTWESPDYPVLLRSIDYAPPVLYMRGHVEECDEWALAVVGTRRASSYGREATRRLVEPLAQAGLTIVSGLALGVDGEAHRAALAAGGRTIAVLGSGIDIIYPSEHRRLADEIAGRAAVLTEFPLGTAPDKKNFPTRNRIISGLSRGVLIVEAGISSGALITARFAAEQGRDVFAVPGSILTPRHRGTNMLISNGAVPVMTPGDVLRELQLEMLPQKRQARHSIAMTDEERRLLACLGDEPLHIDEIGRRLGMPIGVVSGNLTMLELKGMIRDLGGNQYTKAS